MATSLVPGFVGAQTLQKSKQIALLHHLYPSTFHDTFVRQLAELGHVEGRNLVVMRRYAKGNDEALARYLQEALQQRVDLVFTPSGPATRTTKAAGDAIPIVAFDMEIDPVNDGLIASFARPGGNLTGVFLDLSELRGKQVDLLKRIVPGVQRIAVLWDPSTSHVPLHATEQAAASAGINVQTVHAQRIEDLGSALAAIGAHGAQALFIVASPLFYQHRAMIAEHAIKQKIPALTQFREFADAGGLMAYGPNLHELFRRCASLAARILAGAKPADLPVERPSKYELVINLRTANSLGLVVPPQLLFLADEALG